MPRIGVDELRGLSGFLGSHESEIRAGAFPFTVDKRLTGVVGSCNDGAGTASDSSPANMPLRELPHPFEVLSSSFSRGGMGLFCAKARLASTSLTLMLRRLVCFDAEVTSLKSFATGVVIGEPSFPGMFTRTIEPVSDSWLSLKGSLPVRMSGSGFERLGLATDGVPVSLNTSEVEDCGSLLGKGGTGGRKVSEKAADADEMGVGIEPLIVRLRSRVLENQNAVQQTRKPRTDRSRTVVCPHILPRKAVVFALTEFFAI